MLSAHHTILEVYMPNRLPNDIEGSRLVMSNMESKLKPGLFMCGEVLDVNGVIGGFNFMGCWSTGFAAGEGAAQHVLD